MAEGTENKQEGAADSGRNSMLVKVVAAVLVIVALGWGYYYSSQRKGMLTSKQAEAKVLDFVNNNLVAPGTKVEVKEIKEASGMYQIILKVRDQEVTTYLTKDGKTFFPSAIELDKKDDSSKQAEAPKDIPKSDKPAVDLYVMSFCPFGNKAEDTLKPVYDLLKNKADFNFHYIVNSQGDTIQSLHGEKEVAQDEREACILKNYGKDKWMGFVTYVNAKCGSDGSCWEAGAKSLGINPVQVSACVKSEGVALMKTNEKAANDAGAQGSPTMLINGVETQVVYQYGNSEGYKKAICDAFNAAPEECAKTLASNTATTQGGSCGN